MGGSMSIVNETNVPLNVALKQLTPLYYQNSMKPGETMYRNTGAVHWTVEAFVDWGENSQYSDWQSIIPIGLLSLGIVMTATGAVIGVIGALGAFSGLASAETLFVAGTWLLRFGTGTVAVTGTKQSLESFLRNGSVSSAGWYAGYNHKLAIRGGPDYAIVDGKKVLQLDGWKPFEIVQI
nr:11359_t:CDS:1 [Entrophospora candida]